MEITSLILIKFSFTLDFINLNFHQKIVKMAKSGRCRQVNVSILVRFRWSLVVFDRWSLFRGSFSDKIAWSGFRVVVSTGLTV